MADAAALYERYTLPSLINLRDAVSAVSIQFSIDVPPNTPPF